MAEHGGSTKTILFALGANLAIAVAKTVAAVMSGSGSMAAEAVHSFADCANQLLLLLGLRAAAKPPDAEHPLGYGRAIYFWSFIVALMLFSGGGLFSIYEGIHKLSAHEPLDQARSSARFFSHTGESERPCRAFENSAAASNR